MTTIRESLYRTVARTGCAVAFSAVLALGLGAPSARAQTSQDYDRSAAGIEFLTRSAAFNGYSDGFEKGAEDLKIGPDFTPQHDVTFLRAETGYTSDMGLLADYQSAFRQAYGRGYADARSGQLRDPSMHVPPPPPEPDSRGWRSRGPAIVSGGTHLSVASAKGYDAGYAHGTEDKSQGGGFGYREDEIYRVAADGYDPSLGDAARYQTVFRQIYARGYSDGYNGRERYTDTTTLAVAPLDSSPIDSRASESGYRAGLERGQYDRKVNAHTPNPQGHGAYQSALDGWDPKLGDRAAYQQEFRKSFVRGYDEGFNSRKPTPSSRP